MLQKIPVNIEKVFIRTKYDGQGSCDLTLPAKHLLKEGPQPDPICQANTPLKTKTDIHGYISKIEIKAFYNKLPLSDLGVNFNLCSRNYQK